MGNTYQFEAGVEELDRRIRMLPDPLRLVGVYGLPDAGKSTLINHMRSRLEPEFTVIGNTGAMSEDSFVAFRDRQEDFGPQPYVMFFHTGADRVPYEEKDPGYLSQKILGRPLDIAVAIYNPSHSEMLFGEYDMIIENPHSLHKKRDE